jgi:hypothetical protein
MAFILAVSVCILCDFFCPVDCEEGRSFRRSEFSTVFLYGELVILVTWQTFRGFRLRSERGVHGTLIGSCNGCKRRTVLAIIADEVASTMISVDEPAALQSPPAAAVGCSNGSAEGM